MAGQVISKVATSDGSTHLIANSFYGVCTTAASTVAKPVIIVDPDITNAITPVPGTMLTVKFTNYNSGSSPTLTLYNNSGSTTTPTQGSTTLLAAKSIARYGTTTASTTTATSGRSGAVVPFVYDGTRGVETSSIDDNTTYSNASLGQGRGTCSTAEGTAAKVVTLASYALTTGGIVSIYFSTANTTDAPTLNINSKGAKNIFVDGVVVSATNPLKGDAGSTLTFIYDGTQYHLIAAPIPSSTIDDILEDNNIEIPELTETFPITITTQSYASNYALELTTGYYKNGTVTVPVQMMKVSGGSALSFMDQEVATIPAAYAPSETMGFPVTCVVSGTAGNMKNGNVAITPTGSIIMTSPDTCQAGRGILTYVLA